ncbi:MAG: aminotransferase class V-fold PLP-dependent enzyme [Phycisphaeraceae bacterium]|nr:aminotransferase class V-fold PLP-dependent enzyme [Phycisphaeraceae bacterium]
MSSLAPIIGERIRSAAEPLGSADLTEAGLQSCIAPLFSRVRRRTEIYLANHSLGRPLDLLAEDVREALDAWYADMDGAWDVWMKEMTTFRHNIACLIGLHRADAVVPKTSAGQGLRAVLNALPTEKPRVIATRGEFDSIDFILKTYDMRGRAPVRWVEARTEPDRPPKIDADLILDAIRSESPDLVVISHIYYATGQRLDRIEEIIGAAHAKGALVLLDAFHSAGVIPVEFEKLDADFAIGGSYKYTRGGPGAAWLAIHPRHLDNPRLCTLDTGWFAKRDTFGFERPDIPQFADGGDAWLEATPAPLPLFQARSGLQLVLAIGVERLRKYSLAQLETLSRLLNNSGVASYRGDPDPRLAGAFLLIPNRAAPRACGEIKGAGVNVDARLGHLRLCPDVVTTNEEMTRASAIIAKVLAR